ncbi:Inner membrane protein YjjP [invertebrate metagenome]|uniref:Inner membrane protein YjjP n=1 Tax=invertebrate metagenome TaxID=1711999 RepID=A0A2H9TBG9_9ZZZZ
MESGPSSVLRLQKCTDMLLDVAVLLLSSGAHTERVNRNVSRMAKAFGYQLETLFSFSGITLTVLDPLNSGLEFTAFRKVQRHDVHLGIVAGISTFSWNICEKELDLVTTAKEIEQLKHLPRYPSWLVKTMVTLAGIAFCSLNGGDILAMLLTGTATVSGFWVKSFLLGKGYNLPLSICCAAIVASGLSGLGIVFHVGADPEVAVATSVLFLIPGAPLICGVIDLLQGHIVTGQARVIFGSVIAFVIALGMVISSALLGIA